MTYIFCHKYILESHNISRKNEFSFRFNYLCYGLPCYVKSMEKYAPKLPWLKFKHYHWKTIRCDNIFGPSIVYFHPLMGLLKNKTLVRQYFPLYFNIILSSEIFSQFSQVLHLSHNSFTKYFTLTKFVKIISISIIHIVKRVSNMKTPIDFQKSRPPHD